jgi:hypothetical protein
MESFDELPLSAQTLAYVAGVIRRHRAKIGSCWRKLNPGRQALLVLDHLLKGETFAALAAGFGVGTATAQPKHWGILRKLRCCPWHAGTIWIGTDGANPDRLAPAPAHRE